MKDNYIVIPEGWTYFAHRSNTERWKYDPFTIDVIKVEKIMSVVTESEINDEFIAYGKNHILGYSLGNGEGFEIRTLICSLPYIRKLDTDNNMRNIMLNEFYYDRNNFGGCYGHRHHSIPKNEELIIIGIGEHDDLFDKDRKIIWTIPRRFVNFYVEDIRKKHNRIIDLNSSKNNDINKHL